MEKYLDKSAEVLEEMLDSCLDYQERRHIRAAIRNKKGLRIEGDRVLTLSFGLDTVKRLSSGSSKASVSDTDKNIWNELNGTYSPDSPVFTSEKFVYKTGTGNQSKGYFISPTEDKNVVDVLKHSQSEPSFRSYLNAGNIGKGSDKENDASTVYFARRINIVNNESGIDALEVPQQIKKSRLGTRLGSDSSGKRRQLSPISSSVSRQSQLLQSEETDDIGIEIQLRSPKSPLSRKHAFRDRKSTSDESDRSDDSLSPLRRKVSDNLSSPDHKRKKGHGTSFSPSRRTFSDGSLKTLASPSGNHFDFEYIDTEMVEGKERSGVARGGRESERRKKPSKEVGDLSVNKLQLQEEQLQEALRKCQNFSERRKIRAEIRQLREKRTALENAEKEEAAVGQGTPVGEITPGDNHQTENEVDYIQIKDIGVLRQLLSDSTDYSEKRKIRLALRQLRQQDKERNGGTPGLTNGFPEEHHSSLQRRHSSVEPLKSSFVSETPVVKSSQSSLSRVPKSRSFLDKLDRESNRGSSLPPGSVEHSNSNSVADNSRPNKSDSKRDSWDLTCDNTISKHSRDGPEDNLHSIPNGFPESYTSSASLRKHSHSTADDKARLPAEDCTSPHIDEKHISPDSALLDTEKKSSFRSSRTYSTGDRAGNNQNLRGQRSKSTSSVPGRTERNKVLISSADVRRDSKDKHSSHRVKDKEESASSSSKLSPLSKSHDQNKDSETSDISPTRKSFISLGIKPKSFSTEWLESKKKSSQKPSEVNKLLSTMDIEAAFSEILEGVETETEGNIASSKGNQMISEEEDTGFGIQKKALDVNHSAISNSEEDIQGPESTISTQDKQIASKGTNSKLQLNLSSVGDKNGAISVIHGDDGSVSLQEVRHHEEGDKVITERKKISRTDSKSEVRETDTIVESKITSPGGSSSVYEKDVTKTKRKLTSRGSDYFQRNNYNIKRHLDKEGTETILHELCLESENVSVSQGESWGDHVEAQVTLNKGNNILPPTILEDGESTGSAVRPSQDSESGSSSVFMPSQPHLQVNRQSVSKASSGYGSVSGSDDDDHHHHRSEDIVETKLGKPSGSPEITFTLRDINPVEGSTAVLECTVVSSPLPTVKWFKGDNLITESDRIQSHFDGATGKACLSLTNVQSTDFGFYRCVFHNPLGEAESKAKLSVKKKATRLPKFKRLLSDKNMTEGQCVLLECSVFDADSVSWYKDGIIQRNSADFKQTFDGVIAKLEIGEIFLDDSGEYSCIARNSIGEARVSCRLNVKESTAEGEVVPMFLTKPQSQIIDEEDTVFIECEVIGSPMPNISWYKDDTLVKEEMYCTSYDGRVARCIVRRAMFDDSGKFECVAENSAGKIAADCMLVVKVVKKPPILAQPLSDVTLTSGMPLSLECYIVGSPKPTVLWRKDGRIIGQMFDFKQSYIDGKAKLEVPSVCVQDAGCYECIARNDNGEKSTSCVLTVQAEAKPEQTTEKSTEEVKASPKQFSSRFKPRVDAVEQDRAKSTASKVMLVRQSSLKSMNRDRVQKSGVQRSESMRQVSRPNQTGPGTDLSVDVSTVKAVQPVSSQTASRVEISNFESSSVKISEPVTLQTGTRTESSRGQKSSDKTAEPVMVLSPVSRTVSKESFTFDRNSTEKDKNKNEIKIIVDNVDSDSELEKDKKLEENNNTWNKISLEKDTKVIEDTKDTKSQVSSAKSSVVDKNGSKHITDTKTVKTISNEEKKSDPFSSVYLDMDNKPSWKRNVETNIRRSQSMKTPERPAWVGMKLKRVEGSSIARSGSERSLAGKENEGKGQSSKEGGTDNVQEKSAKTPSVQTKSETDSVNLKLDTKFDASSTKTESSTSKTVLTNDRSGSERSFINQAKSSFENDTSKTETVMPERRVFPLRKSNSKSGSDMISPSSIIAKALQLDRSNSMKGNRSGHASGLHQSQSVKVGPTQQPLGGVVLDLAPPKSQGVQGEKFVSSKRQLWESGRSSTPDKMPSYDTMTDEDELHKLLNASDNMEERKKIRARIREIRDEKTRQWEADRRKREEETEKLIRKKYEAADKEKQAKLEAFKVQATQPRDERALDVADRHLKEKMKAADLEKKKALERFDRIAAGEDAVTVVTETKDGKTTTTTTVRKQETRGFGGTAYSKPGAEETAQKMSQQIINMTSPATSGRISVKTESWSSKDGVTHQSEKTETWGGGARAAFQKMDAASPGAKPNFGGGAPKGANITRSPSAIKTMLLEWCKAMTREYTETIEITNFSTSWNNGLAFCALIHHFYPEAFDFSKLDGKNRRSNFELAFDTAEKYADIAPLLDVEDMVRMKKPDWKCVFTYVQSFYRKLKDHDMNRVKPVEQ